MSRIHCYLKVLAYVQPIYSVYFGTVRQILQTHPHTSISVHRSYNGLRCHGIHEEGSLFDGSLLYTYVSSGFGLSPYLQVMHVWLYILFVCAVWWSIFFSVRILECPYLVVIPWMLWVSTSSVKGLRVFISSIQCVHTFLNGPHRLVMLSVWSSGSCCLSVHIICSCSLSVHICSCSVSISSVLASECP